MPDSMPRLALAFAGIVAIIVIALVIKDYVQQQKRASPPGAVSAKTVANAKTKDRFNKGRSTGTSPKVKRARLSTPTANAKQPGQDEEKQPINAEFAGTGATTMTSSEDDTNAVRTHTAKRIIQSLNHDNGLRNELDMFAGPGSSTCLPLPNRTELGDVDAHYYDNWAGEYCDR
jgi:hypothetical protein